MHVCACCTKLWSDLSKYHHLHTSSEQQQIHVMASPAPWQYNKFTIHLTFINTCIHSSPWLSGNAISYLLMWCYSVRSLDTRYHEHNSPVFNLNSNLICFQHLTLCSIFYLTVIIFILSVHLPLFFTLSSCTWSSQGNDAVQLDRDRQIEVYYSIFHLDLQLIGSVPKPY